MKFKTPIRRNEFGLYVVCNGSKAYPGEVIGYSHAMRMDAADLKEGDKVNVRHVPQTPLVRIRTESGVDIYWHSDYNGIPVSSRGY